MTTKEMRKHIKPYLKYAINELQVYYNDHDKVRGLCGLASDYSWSVLRGGESAEKLSKYLQKRLDVARPKDSKGGEFWWLYRGQSFGDRHSVFHLQKRIDFCKLQLKIVKP